MSYKLAINCYVSMVVYLLNIVFVYFVYFYVHDFMTLCSLRVVCFLILLFVLLYDINPPHALANKYAKQI